MFVVERKLGAGGRWNSDGSHATRKEAERSMRASQDEDIERMGLPCAETMVDYRIRKDER